MEREDDLINDVKYLAQKAEQDLSRKDFDSAARNINRIKELVKKAKEEEDKD